MSHFAPPSGPPPPKVPEGWKAQYNEQYQEWFYINLITEKSQWERPTSPARVDSTVVPPPGPPPSYDAGPASGAALNASGDRKSGPSPSLGSNNPYSSRATEHGSNSHIDEDARLAAQLQAEEDAQARRERGGPSPGTGGANTDYYSNAPPPQHQQQPYQQGAYTSSPRPEEQQRGKSGGFLGKLLGKGKHSSSSQQQYYQQPQGGYGYGGTPSGYAPGPGYGPGAGYYGQQQQYAQRPGRSGGGMGTAGAAALGVGGGLLGGMLLADAIDDHDDHDGGYDDGGYDNDGGDFGGGDF